MFISGKTTFVLFPLELSDYRPVVGLFQVENSVGRSSVGWSSVGRSVVEGGKDSMGLANLRK